MTAIAPMRCRTSSHSCPPRKRGLNCGVDYAKRMEPVLARLTAAANRTRAAPSSAPRLLAVSKARNAAEVRAAHTAGQREFGENYVQEAAAKIAALADLDIVWHFIGAIQSNKTRDIADHFQWVHTVDRTKIASRLNAAAGDVLDVCIQVNVDVEPQKAGVAPAELPALVAHIAGLPRLRLRGLMVIPRQGGDSRQSFRRTRLLFEAMAPCAGPHWDTLSMGMSDDFEAAVEEGATIVRIGTAIFGPRPVGQASGAVAHAGSV